MVQDDLVRLCLEEMLDTNASPEDACADRPEILPEVRRRWRELLATRASVDALFPKDGIRASDSSFDALPQLPGYQDLEVVGRGGMGIVFRARHSALGRLVAIKMLLPGAFDMPSEADALVREASAVAALRHPNIVQVHDVGTFQGRPYFTMEYLDGGSLPSHTRGTPQSATSAATLTETLALAMQAAHEAGIVHRDLKPGNVLYTATGTPKIVDFGIARRIDRDPSATFIDRPAGTPSYMAPEQAICGDGRCMPAVDVYSLGAILYELLTGRPPFRASTAVETCRQILDTEPASPTTLNAAIPRDLETICLKCLRKNPASRYASARALAEDLRRFLDGRPVEARPASALQRTLKWTRRRPAHAALVALSCALLMSVAVGATWIGARRAGIQAAAESDLARAMELLGAARLGESRHFLALAQTRIGTSKSNAINKEIAAIVEWLGIAEKLELVRLERATSAKVHFDRPSFSRKYESLLREAGLLGEAGESLEATAERMRASPIRSTVIEALNDWAYCSSDKGDLQRRLILARLVDPDPAWRDKVRSVLNWSNRETLVKLAENVPNDPQVVSLAPIFAGVLMEGGLDPIEFLRKVQARHPSDFWANFNLAEYLELEGDSEAIGFYRAAHALKPESSAALVNLGGALYREGEDDEARALWARAVFLEPSCAPALFNLAIEAIAIEDMDQAQDLVSKAIVADSAWALPKLLEAELMSKRGASADASRMVEKAIESLPPNDPLVRAGRVSVAKYNALAALEARAAEYADGSRVPATADEAHDLTGILLSRGESAAAARMAVLSIAMDEAAARDPASGRRYLAACAASIALADPSLSAEERAQVCSRALEWLGQEADALDAVATTDQGNLMRRRTFERWLATPRLAPLRDAQAREDLNPELRREVREFWKRVRSVAKDRN